RRRVPAHRRSRRRRRRAAVRDLGSRRRREGYRMARRRAAGGGLRRGLRLTNPSRRVAQGGRAAPYTPGMATRILARARHALAEFLRLEAAGGILLIAAAALALVFANSPLEAAYDAFREMPLAVTLGGEGIDKPPLLWINDGMMAVFFLRAALEIKREALSGQLSRRGPP